MSQDLNRRLTELEHRINALSHRLENSIAYNESASATTISRATSGLEARFEVGLRQQHRHLTVMHANDLAKRHNEERVHDCFATLTPLMAAIDGEGVLAGDTILDFPTTILKLNWINMEQLNSIFARLDIDVTTHGTYELRRAAVKKMLGCSQVV